MAYHDNQELNKWMLLRTWKHYVQTQLHRMLCLQIWQFIQFRSLHWRMWCTLMPPRPRMTLACAISPVFDFNMITWVDIQRWCGNDVLLDRYIHNQSATFMVLIALSTMQQEPFHWTNQFLLNKSSLRVFMWHNTNTLSMFYSSDAILMELYSTQIPLITIVLLPTNNNACPTAAQPSRIYEYACQSTGKLRSESMQIQHPMNAVLYWCGTQNGIRDTPWLHTGETELCTIQGTWLLGKTVIGNLGGLFGFNVWDSIAGP